MEQRSDDPLTSMSVSLPQSLRDFAEERSRAEFGSASEYVRALIRSDRNRLERERLEALLLAGLESDGVVEASPEFFERKKTELQARAEEG